MTDLDLEQLHDAVIVSDDGRTIGQVGQVFLDEVSRAPVFVTVPVGLLASRSTFVPLRGARLENGQITVPFERSLIRQAPLLDTDGLLDPEQAEGIYRHYGLSPVE